MTDDEAGVVVLERYWLRRYNGDPIPENLAEVVEIRDGQIMSTRVPEPGQEAALWRETEDEMILHGPNRN